MRPAPSESRGHARSRRLPVVSSRKLLTTGEGGAVLSDDLGLIEEIRARRAHGLQARPASSGVPSLPGEGIDLPQPGLNYRLPELGAAIGRAPAGPPAGLIARHRELAERYRDRLSGYGLTFQTDHPGRIYQTFAVVLPAGCDRSALRQGSPMPVSRRRSPRTRCSTCQRIAMPRCCVCRARCRECRTGI